MACYCAWTDFFAVKTLLFTCLSIKLLCDRNIITTQMYIDTGTCMTANLVLRMTTTVIKVKVKVEFSLEKVWKWQCFDCKFLEIWEWLKKQGVYYICLFILSHWWWFFIKKLFCWKSLTLLLLLYFLNIFRKYI